MEARKKVKYVQKTLLVQKQQQQQPLFLQKAQRKYQVKEENKGKVKHVQKQKFQKTEVVNVKVQYLRRKGYKNLLEWLEDPKHLYVGRHNHYVPGATASIWANPFKVDQHGRNGCIQKYKEYILGNQQLMQQIHSLKGKALGCWCHPQGCHGDVLAELADAYPDQ